VENRALPVAADKVADAGREHDATAGRSRRTQAVDHDLDPAKVFADYLEGVLQRALEDIAVQTVVNAGNALPPPCATPLA